MMKRNFAALVLLLIPALITSCWKTGEDWSLCGVDDNLILTFRVQDDSDLTFRNNINNADVYLFDGDRNYMEHKHVSQSELDLFRGVTFSVVPGTYHVVCWANVDGDSHITDISSSNSIESSYIEIASTVNGSPVYYAPYKIPVTRSGNSGHTRAEDYTIYAAEVLPNTKTVKELTFSKVHRTVQIYISGYEELDVYDGQAPVVELSNTAGKYDFLLRADLTPRTFRQPTLYRQINDENMFNAEFYSALIPVRSDMHVYIHHPASGNILADINIEQYIADNNITDDSVIPIMVIFNMDASVTITLPSWLDNSITPGR